VVLRAFGVVVGHSPSTILSLTEFVSRSPPDNSCMYPSWISRSLCSTGIARCVKPLAQSRNETNSSWVNGGGAGAIPRICANSSSGRLISSNVATWVLSNQDSNVAPQTSQDARPRVRHQELCFSAFVLGAAIASDNCRHCRNMRPEPPIFQCLSLPQSN
jgi:hypothetical protein